MLLFVISIAVAHVSHFEVRSAQWFTSNMMLYPVGEDGTMNEAGDKVRARYFPTHLRGK